MERVLEEWLLSQRHCGCNIIEDKHPEFEGVDANGVVGLCFFHTGLGILWPLEMLLEARRLQVPIGHVG